MPPENTNPVVKGEVSEFEFDKPQGGSSRIRKRSLKVKPAAENAPTTPASTPASAPAPSPDQPRPAVYVQPAAGAAPASTDQRPAPVRPSTGEPSALAASQPSGVLYYSNGPHKEASMKTTPLSQAARPAPASASQPIPQRTAAAAAATAAQAPINRSASAPQSAAASSAAQAPVQRSASSAPASAASHTAHAPAHVGSAAARPSGTTTSAAASPAPASSGASRAISTTIASPASSSKPAGVSDYRSNIDRQSREQKSIGGILNFIVYALIGLFVVGTALAAYGAHDVYRQLRSQSVTVSDLDTRYSAANQQLNDQLKVTEQSVIQLQNELAHSQELALRQQDAIGKLQTSLDAETAALREERATRAAETSIRESETSTLRSRIRNLEKNEITFHP
jgi:hypothetical protein